MLWRCLPGNHVPKDQSEFLVVVLVDVVVGLVEASFLCIS